jgi:hypothetical protein
MKKSILALLLLFTGFSLADTPVIDSTMAASDNSEHMEYQDRGSFGPYVEFGNVKKKNVNYAYKIHGKKYDISIDNSYVYGASGSMPLTEWFDIYLMAGYQYLGVSHHPRNREDALADLEALAEDDLFDPVYDKDDIDGWHDIHTALFQFGFDFSLPLVYSYKNQLMLKPYIFGGVIFGKTFFSDDAKFLSPVLYGYAYGAGIRCAWDSFFLSGGFRNSHEYFHTYFERKTGKNKEDDEFMLDFDTYFAPYVSLGITLF